MAGWAGRIHWDFLRDPATWHNASPIAEHSAMTDEIRRIQAAYGGVPCYFGVCVSVLSRFAEESHRHNVNWQYMLPLAVSSASRIRFMEVQVIDAFRNKGGGCTNQARGGGGCSPHSDCDWFFYVCLQPLG